MTATRSEMPPTKRCSLLRRRRSLTHDAFRAHWAGPHADIARLMPGIARYTQNRIADRLWSLPVPAFDCDGIVELEFRDARAMSEANASDAVQRLLPEDEPRFVDAITLCRVPAGACQTRAGRTKAMLAARLSDSSAGSLDALREAVQASGCIECSIDPVQGSFHRQQLSHEAEPPHAFATLWFEPQADLRAAFAEGSGWDRAARACIVRGTVWHIDALPIIG